MCGASPKRRFGLNHPVGDVMDGHGVDGYGLAGIKQLAHRRTALWFEGDLAKSVIEPDAGGFGVDEDKHAVVLGAG